jgi:ATP-dependent DNA helicase RecG
VDGVPDPLLRDLVAAALLRVMGGVKDPLPEDLIARHRLLPLDEALRDGHFPANASFRGRTRLAFEELLAMQLGLSRRLGRGAGDRGFAHRILHASVGSLQVQLGVTLDDEQELAFAEIRRDLLRPVPMTRVLEGDVGTRKGLVALMSAVIVAENRAQVAVVTHDAAAAERQFLFAEPLLRAIGIRALYVGDTVSHAGADAIRRGEAAVVYGTPRVVTGEVEWRRLGLVIALEQGELGIMLPGQLDARGPRPDLLVVAAAPAPTSLLLSAYGPFDISSIRRKDGQPVTVNVYNSAEREAAYEVVREAVSAGRPALVVFPTRDGRDLLSRDDATRVAEALRRDFLPEARVVVFSAEMSREERARVFDDLQHRRIDVLVSTTPIEDGPPVPSCTVVVVEHADHYDLARLHRLRGYASFGRRPGQCLLVLSDDPSAEGERRARRMASEGGRMEFTDEDLGVPGGLRATAAASALEAPMTQWAEFPRDRGLLLDARAEAFALLREDSALRAQGGLRRLIQERWPELLGDAAVGPTPGDAGRNRKRKRRRRRR